jgi:NADPH-dependent 2,4-dienoyl-CoA reductase/sulfur reductase-like enzyme
LQGALTASGQTLPCDLVALGIGVTPEVEFLKGSGIKIDNGIQVNEYLQTNKSNVFAAGDIANYFDSIFGMHRRFEHCDNAIKQGRLVAKNMLGQKKAYNCSTGRRI